MIYLNEIHELLGYCQSAKAVLRARDQKQVDFEELSGYWHKTIKQRDRILHPGRNMDGISIQEYVTDKLNEVRGVNMEQARRDKLSRLERRIKEVKTA